MQLDLDLTWALAGAVVGAAAGVLARGVAFRYAVAHGQPPRTGCPECGRRYPVLGVRCAGCGRRHGVPLAVEAITAVVLAAVFGSHPGQWATLAFGFLGVVGVALAVIDVAVQRLPHRLTLAALPVLVGLLGVAALADGNWTAFWRALLGGLVLGAAFYVLALVGSGQLGGGDVVLSMLLGTALGWLGWPVLIAGALLSFVLFTVVALVLLATRRVGLRSHLAFGPFMLAGALLAAVVL